MRRPFFLSARMWLITIVVLLMTGCAAGFFWAARNLYYAGRRLGPRAHANRVARVAFSPDGMTLGSASNDQTAKLWDVTTGRVRHVLGHAAHVWEIDLSAGGGVVATGSSDGMVKLWEVRSGQSLATFRASDCEITGLAFSSNGRLLVTSGRSPSGDCKLWDARNLSFLRPLAESCCIVSFAFSPDNALLAGGHLSGGFTIWDVATGEPKYCRVESYFLMTHSVAFLPDGKTLMTANGERVEFWSVDSHALDRSIIVPPRDVLSCAAVSPNGRLLATGLVLDHGNGPGEIILWDTRSGKQLAVLGGFAPIETLAFSPDSELLASGGCNSEVEVRSVAEILAGAAAETGKER
jgi:WD40 repeat protein